MRKFMVLVATLSLLTPVSATASSPQKEVELAFEKTTKYLYSNKGSITLNVENRLIDGQTTRSEYIRDKNGTEYYGLGNYKVIKDKKNTYLHSSYLREHTPFDKILPENENVMFILPKKLENFYLYGKNSQSDALNPKSDFMFLALRNYLSPSSKYSKKPDGKYLITDQEARENITISLNASGLITEITVDVKDNTGLSINEKYNYSEIANILTVLPKYDYKNLDTYAKTDQYNSLYYSRLINDNLGFIYRMAGISSKRNDPLTGALQVKDITSADISSFFKEIKFWYRSSNSLSTDKGYKQIGDKVQQSLKGYNNKLYTGCLSKEGNTLKFTFSKC
ncbi:MAG: hypothetical protein ACKOW9_05330 [Candidatus Paceibacterota bacterium]